MIEKMLAFLRKYVMKIFAPGAVNESLAISSDMESAIGLWAHMYESGGPWVRPGAPCLGLSAAIANEFARLITVEANIKFSGTRANFLTNAFAPLLQNLRNYTAYACALGGGVFKPFVQNGKVHIEFVQADNFIPLEFDAENNLTAAVFCDQIQDKKGVYTRLEKHSFEDGIYTIENRAFFSSQSALSGGHLGSEINLNDIVKWKNIKPALRIKNLNAPLFAYLKMPGANNIDRRSALGVSVYSRAQKLIRDADAQYARLIWEFEGGELAIDAASDVLMNTGENGFKMPRGKERLFRSVNADDADFYKVFSPQLRDESLKNGLEIMLKRIEFNCALAYGTLSDPVAVHKTAEEIRAGKQRSFAAVKDMQSALQSTLTQLANAVNTLADLYKLAPAGAYKMMFDWDDSIIADDKYEREQMRQDCSDGIAQPYEYRMKYYAEDEQTAKSNVVNNVAGENNGEKTAQKNLYFGNADL